MPIKSFFKIESLKFLLNFLSIKKIVNIYKILSSYYLSKLLNKYYVWGKPYFVSIEPTGLCNLECPECPVGLGTLTRPQINLMIENFKKIVDNIYSHTLILQLYFQGEPFINKSIIDMIDYAYQKGIYSVISTNGLNMDRPEFAKKIVNSNLGKLIVSIDGASEETYNIYRKSGDFNKLVEGIKLVCAEKKLKNSMFPIIDLQFIVMKHNEHEIEEIKKLGELYGVDQVSLKTAQMYNFDNADNFLPKDEKYRRYHKVEGEYKLKGTYSGYCQKLWISSVVTADSQVLPCCFDKDASYPFGSIDSNSFDEIWETGKYHKFRKSVIKDRNNIDICKNCSEGLKTFEKY